MAKDPERSKRNSQRIREVQCIVVGEFGRIGYNRAGTRQDHEQMNRKISLNIVNIIGISVIVLYWVAYALMTPFANAGDYRYFSYSVWEFWSLGFLLVPTCTAIWLLVVVVKSAKGKSWKMNITIMLLLAVLLAGQVGIEYIMAHGVTTTTVGWVNEVGDGKFDYSNGAETRTISCHYETTALLKSDGTMYVITYSWNSLFKDKATLSTISEAGYNRSQTEWADITS